MSVAWAASLDNAQVSAFAVMKFTTATATQEILFKGSSNAFADGWALGMVAGATSINTVGIYVNNYATHESHSVDTVNVWHLVGGTYDQVNVQGYLDATAAAPSALAAAVNNGANIPIAVGAYWAAAGATATNPMSGSIAEILVYPTGLSSGDVAIVHAIMSAQFGTP